MHPAIAIWERKGVQFFARKLNPNYLFSPSYTCCWLRNCFHTSSSRNNIQLYLEFCPRHLTSRTALSGSPLSEHPGFPSLPSSLRLLRPSSSSSSVKFPMPLLSKTVFSSRGTSPLLQVHHKTLGSCPPLTQTSLCAQRRRSDGRERASTTRSSFLAILLLIPYLIKQLFTR